MNVYLTTWKEEQSDGDPGRLFCSSSSLRKLELSGAAGSHAADKLLLMREPHSSQTAEHNRLCHDLPVFEESVFHVAGEEGHRAKDAVRRCEAERAPCLADATQGECEFCLMWLLWQRMRQWSSTAARLTRSTVLWNHIKNSNMMTFLELNVKSSQELWWRGAVFISCHHRPCTHNSDAQIVDFWWSVLVFSTTQSKRRLSFQTLNFSDLTTWQLFPGFSNVGCLI